MTGPILFSLVVAFVWFIVSIYYQFAFRPFACDSIRFSVFRIRDDLRRLAISKEVDPSSFAFCHLETMLNRMIHTCAWYGVSSFIEFRLTHGSAPPHPDIERFDAEAPQSLKALESEALDEMLKIMVVNSPGWLAVASVAFVCAALKRKAIRSSVTVSNRILWYADAIAAPM